MAISIALISDTHSYIDEGIIAHLNEADEVWHAGDIGAIDVVNRFPKGKVVRVVTGNIDDSEMRQRFPEELSFDVEGLRVLMVHIGGNPGRYARGIKSRIQESGATLFVCGHSHLCRVEHDRQLNCLYMNPGAAGIQGFHKMRTLLKFKVAGGKISDLVVVELGKRGMPGQN
ncbi:MAG: metallophosphoesterase family protein [Lunatimonas sp.]|uniref:metallophosphoesterase family protein n=1 Tax=Lunatimonas sp. TaxID=2060141 RepID=UPI00263A3EB8|nr:metallophosphoesterase family protein [Lunatimonas sp.]MCC5938703.1 metallophosphoesterase family protein [Lunatimonas sp.]